MNEKPPWFVFYGTITTVVRADNEPEARAAFLAAHCPVRDGGRIIPPTRNEVTVRRPRESDRGWIEDSGDAAFLALLPELSAGAQG